MVNFFSRQRSVAAIDLNNGEQLTTVLCSTDGIRTDWHYWDSNFEECGSDGPFTQLLKKHSPDALVLLLGESYAICSTAEDVSRENLEMTIKRKHGAGAATFDSDVINVSDRQMLISINPNKTNGLVEMVRGAFPTVPLIIFNHIMVAMVYGYTRCYYTQFSSQRAALIHISSDYISLVIMQGDAPVYTATAMLESDNISLIGQMLRVANTKTRRDERDLYDMLIVSGRFNQQDLLPIEELGLATKTIKANPTANYNAIASMPPDKSVVAANDSQYFAPAVFAACMHLENVGINVTGADIALSNTIPHEKIHRQDKTAIGHGIDSLSYFFATTAPLILEQKSLIAIAFILALVWAGWQCYHGYTEENRMVVTLSAERAREQQLSEVKKVHDEYDAKMAAIKARRDLLDDIRKKQLTEYTVMDHLDENMTNDLALNFSDLSIDGNTVTIKGSTIDRGSVFAFTNRLGRDSNNFADIDTVYDSKSDKGDYVITMHYIGQVPINAGQGSDIKFIRK